VVATWEGSAEEAGVDLMAAGAASMVAGVASMVAAEALMVVRVDSTMVREGLMVVRVDSRAIAASMGRADSTGHVAWTMAADSATSTVAGLMAVRDWTGVLDSMAERGSTTLPGSMGPPDLMVPPGSMAPDALRAMQTWHGLPPWATGAFAPIR
jgi:hypothetical protein